MKNVSRTYGVKWFFIVEKSICFFQIWFIFILTFSGATSDLFSRELVDKQLLHVQEDIIYSFREQVRAKKRKYDSANG